MENKISSVIIDTSAYYKAQCDFTGINNSIIPMFLRLLKANGIQLLTHPILEYEIRKHIKDSALVKRATELETQVKRCKDQLLLVGVSQAEWLEKIADMNIEKRLADSFAALYKDAVALPYVSAEEVFADYFQAKAPFAEVGKKKSEFPDAFIIKSVLHYCDETPNANVLVVSDDPDWTKSFTGIEGVTLAGTFGEAMGRLWKQLDDKSEFILSILTQNKPEIEARIAEAASHEAFCIESIDTEEEVEITSVQVNAIIDSYVPLDISEGKMLIQIGSALSVDGSADFLDENRSVWDREDQCYYFTAYTHVDFFGASAYVDCEIQIDFSPDGGTYQSKITHVKTVNKWDIAVDLADADTTEEDITDSGERDYLADQADVQEDYFNH